LWMGFHYRIISCHYLSIVLSIRYGHPLFEFFFQPIYFFFLLRSRPDVGGWEKV